MRSNPTDAERRLWERFRRKQIANARFRRQYPLGRYIVDFICLPARLVIEVDGGQHDLQAEADEVRTQWLESQEYLVVRFWNNDVLSNTDGVVERIRDMVRMRLDTPPPTPSRKGRGSKARPMPPAPRRVNGFPYTRCVPSR
ncbi:MAG: endonuclease domain-containing protein [Dongiaceae bacterium]